MSRPKSLPCEIWPISEGMEGEEFPGERELDDVITEASYLFRKAKIGVLSLEEPLFACIREDGEVAGAIFGGLYPEKRDDEGNSLIEASFAVVVSPKPEYARAGIARGLVRAVVEHFTTEAHYREATIVIEPQVVNPHMAALLLSEGFHAAPGGWSPEEPYMTKAVE